MEEARRTDYSCTAKRHAACPIRPRLRIRVSERSMKQKFEGKDLQGLVDLGREQGYLTFDQVNDFLPQDVTSPTDLRSALESFEDMDIKVLDDVPSDGVDGELET